MRRRGGKGKPTNRNRAYDAPERQFRHTYQPTIVHGSKLPPCCLRQLGLAIPWRHGMLKTVSASLTNDRLWRSLANCRRAKVRPITSHSFSARANQIGCRGSFFVLELFQFLGLFRLRFDLKLAAQGVGDKVSVVGFLCP